MGKIVHISWIDPKQSVDRYPAVLEGIKPEDHFSRPDAEYFFVATEKEAQELKAKMEQHIPRKAYTVIDENRKPLMQGGDYVVVSEPDITILDIP